MDIHGAGSTIIPWSSLYSSLLYLGYQANPSGSQGKELHPPRYTKPRHGTPTTHGGDLAIIKRDKAASQSHQIGGEASIRSAVAAANSTKFMYQTFFAFARDFRHWQHHYKQPWATARPRAQ